VVSSSAICGDHIEALRRESRETYGRPRIQADFIDEGMHVSHKRVARLMKKRSTHVASRRKGLAVFDFIEGFYNSRRHHTSIGSISPIEFERRAHAA
jgi:transposase InsO family protein